MTTFERIKKIAAERGLNLKQTALQAGLSENALYRYNQGVEPKFATVKAVADVLGVSTDYLLGNTDEMRANNKTTVKDTVDVEKDPTILSLDGIELTDEYRQFIIDQIRTIRKMRGDDK